MDLIFCPFLTRQRFAELVGVSEDVVTNWVRKGYVKCHVIGKRSLIDMRQWLSEEEKRSAQRPSETRQWQ